MTRNDMYDDNNFNVDDDTVKILICVASQYIIFLCCLGNKLNLNLCLCDRKRVWKRNCERLNGNENEREKSSSTAATAKIENLLTN